MSTFSQPRTWQVEKRELSARASEGAAWVVIGNVSVSAIRFAATAILARMLLPGDFGLVGMGLLFIEMLRPFGAIGLADALVHQRVLDDRDLSTAFWTTLVAGAVLSVATVPAAPLVVWFFDEPLLNWIIPCLGLIFVLNGLGNVHAALLSRMFDFGALARTEIAAALMRSVVMIVMAVLGMGLWSIVTGLVIERAFKSFLILGKVGWMPRAVFRSESLIQLFRFGRNIYGHTIIQYFNRNIDYLVVGRMLGASPLAFYQFAFNIPHLVMAYVSESAERATFSLYSRLQDRTAVGAAYLKSVRLAGVLVLPAMLGLYFVADEVIAVLYGSQWSAAVPPLRILCFAAALNAVFAINQSLVRSQGRPDLAFKWSLAVLPVTAGLVFWGARYGLTGVAWAMFIASLVHGALVWRGLRLINRSVAEYLRALAPGLTSASLMLALLWALEALSVTRSLTELLRLMVNLGMGLLVTLGSLYGLFPGDAKDLWGLGRRTLSGLRPARV